MSEDTLKVGASSMSPPKIDLTPKQVYDPHAGEKPVDIRTHKKLAEDDNKIDTLKLRCDLFDGTITELLEHLTKRTADKEAKADLADLFEWYESRRQKLA